MNEQIETLVSRYNQLSQRQRDSLSEETTKSAFITPLFRALGWNTEDPNEVTMEVAVLSGRADYAFKLHGVTRFYVEAKRVSAEIDDNDLARQAINYAFNKGVPWAVLTNFRQLIVFDAFAEVPRHNPPRRVSVLRVDQYLQPESDLALLTQDAVSKDQLRDLAERLGVRRRPVELQKELYQAMRSWRESLINQIAIVMGYSLEDLPHAEEAVQRLLNRLIFLRNCEDRGISEDRLRALFNQWRANPARVHLADRLSALFARAAATYDSELFKTDSLIDLLLPRLGTQTDNTLGAVLEGLYYPPNSWAEYDFALLDADVLGAVYEQYLGHVAQRARELAAVRATQLALGMDAPHYTLEARRQQRREQGIYYTPKWVVDYIIERTLGVWLQEHGGDSDALERLAVLDPACGSGSFLIRAYETLLEYEATRTNQQVGMLSREEREHILRQNIYGVDLDPQAIEIARLNLLLRMVREEEQLPPLEANVIRGNSLISGGAAKLSPFYGEQWEAKHPLSWERTFPTVMARGGFDVIIGNPPYVRIQALPENDRNYYRANFKSAHGSFDLYVLFIEKAIGLLRSGGRLGLITSGKFLKTEYGKKLIELLELQATVEEIVDLSALQVFGDATTYPVILVASKSLNNHLLTYTHLPETASISTAGELQTVITATCVREPQAVLREGIWPLAVGSKKRILEKMRDSGERLGSLASNVFQGLVTSADAVYTVEFASATTAGHYVVLSKALGKTILLEPDLVRPLIRGASVGRYHLANQNQFLLFPYEETDGVSKLIEWATLRERFPLTADYLLTLRELLENRESGKMKGSHWYGYVYPKNLMLHNRRKLVVPRLVRDLQVAYDPEGLFYLDNVDVGGVILKDPSDNSYLSCLGILNSKLVNFLFQAISVPFRGEFRSANRQFISPIPVVVGQQLNLEVARLALRAQELGARLSTLNVLSAEREALARETRETDTAIDQLVYELYGLTADECRIVEEEMAAR